MMIRSCVMMNDSRDTSMKFGSSARTVAYSVVFADSRIADAAIYALVSGATFLRAATGAQTPTTNPTLADSSALASGL